MDLVCWFVFSDPKHFTWKLSPKAKVKGCKLKIEALEVLITFIHLSDEKLSSAQEEYSNFIFKIL